MAPEGVIIGGWSYVIAAYVITLLGLGAFAWSLRSRRKRIRDERDSQS
jgi:CcmD family protein